MRKSSSADALAAHAATRRVTASGAAERMLDNFARRERERRASFSEIQSWEGLQVGLAQRSASRFCSVTNDFKVLDAHRSPSGAKMKLSIICQ